MKTCKLIIQDEVNVKFQGLELSDRKTLMRMFEYEKPGARFQPSVKLGRWNGKVSYFSLGGTSYINLLPEILPLLDKAGYDIELEDLRNYTTTFSFNKVNENTFSNYTWPKGHPKQHDPIILRDYQVQVINNFLANPQSIQEVATGAGKCLAGDTKLALDIDENTPFGKFLINKLQQEQAIELTIGKLAKYIEEYNGTNLVDNEEVTTSNFGISVPTPSGPTNVNNFIKKFNLPMVVVEFDNGYSVRVAQDHILQQNGNDIFAKELIVGSTVDHRNGIVTVTNITCLENEDCYDIAIGAPHLYYDTNGLIHHNTITTAALSYSVEGYGRSIVIVPNKSLVTQTEEDYRNVGLDVGVYFGDRKEYGKKHTICTWQSLNNLLKDTQSGEAKFTIQEFIEGVVCVMVDEVHQAKADGLKTLLTGVFSQVPIRWGLTGTIPKDKFESQALFVSLGSVIGKLSASELQEKGVLAKCHVNVIQLQDNVEFTNYQSELKHLTENSERLDTIANLINKVSQSGNTLILVDRISAGKELQRRLSDIFSLLKDRPDVAFVSGETDLTERKEEYDEVKTSNNKVIVATYGVASVGLNIPRIFNLVLLEPGKSFVRVIQSIGRGIRKAEDKDEVVIWDVTSNCKFAKRHLTKRKEFYREAKYPFSIEKLTYK